jgi:hypothetical protein
MICYDAENDTFVEEMLAAEPMLVLNPIHSTLRTASFPPPARPNRYCFARAQYPLRVHRADAAVSILQSAPAREVSGVRWRSRRVTPQASAGVWAWTLWRGAWTTSWRTLRIAAAGCAATSPTRVALLSDRLLYPESRLMMIPDRSY